MLFAVILKVIFHKQSKNNLILQGDFTVKFPFFYFLTGHYKQCEFLTNELGVASYEFRVTIYCTSYELLFIYELRVTTYCTSYELLFTYELRVITYCTSYESIFTYELRVTIYCTSYKLN